MELLLEITESLHWKGPGGRVALPPASEKPRLADWLLQIERLRYVLKRAANISILEQTYGSSATGSGFRDV